MNIASILKTSLIDYPDEISSVIFVRGCNFNCKYCYNYSLKTFAEEDADLSMEEVFNILKARKHIIQHVVVTGGEPTVLGSDIFELLSLLKSEGFNIKLDTNGHNPAVLKSLLRVKFLDYVALDIKASPSNYYNVIGVTYPRIDKLLQESLGALKTSGIKFETRTTVWKELFDLNELENIFKFISPFVSTHYIQNFYNIESIEPLTPMTNTDWKFILALGKSYNIVLKQRGFWDN